MWRAGRRGRDREEVRRFTLSILAGLASLVFTASAHADPCTAIPDNGPAPPFLQAGRSFSGPVMRVIDGDSLCIATGSGPASWVEVRLADFYAAESGSPGGSRAKEALERIALGKVARCTAGRQSYDRVVSECTISGRAIGELMRSSNVPEGGRGYPPPSATSPSRHSYAAEAPEATAYASPYRSCREARAAGAAPMYRGTPSYNANLDGDHDGVACEPYRRN
jgi:hypothetical protein